MDDRVLLAFDFGGTKSAVAVTDLDGVIVNRVSIAVADCRDARDVLSQSVQSGLRLVEETQAKHGCQLAGVGVSTMGITLRDRIIMAPNIRGWEELHIPEAMEESFPAAPLRIENDMKASALAELRRGALRGTRSGLYVNLGTGFGTALTYGREVIRGAHGAAGEMAYNLLSSEEALGYRDGVTPLENLLGGRGIGERASRLFQETLSSRDVFERASGDVAARAFIQSTVREMAFHLTNSVISWDPEKVVFGGGVATSKDWIIPVVETYFAQFVPFPPDVDIAHFKRDTGLFGAIELAIEAAASQ